MGGRKGQGGTRTENGEGRGERRARACPTGEAAMESHPTATVQGHT